MTATARNNGCTCLEAKACTHSEREETFQVHFANVLSTVTMTVGTRSGGGALKKEQGRVPLLQALDEKSSKLEDFWNAKTEVVRNKLDRHGAADTSWIESIAECPVYYPTKEDFAQDPLHYIQKIAAEASKFGMCKIVSPVVAQVPAGMVLSKEQSGFKFSTRLQPMRLSSWDKDDKITFPWSGRNYTLTEYEKMANRVFSRKFSTAGNLPPRFIESEFWKELAIGKIRSVEYATDVDGSAFSSSSTDPLGQSKWNLKKISRLPYSVLRLLEEPIPGVTEPMLYIGMLFSMFSWHIEDHYLYSINYQHCGAPKTWYGVPGDAALGFEKVVQEHVYDSELLRDTGKGAELDLLLEKTTMFTPKLLSEQGVPVFKAVQYPGDFIITFPRAYHAGFSHGFNCGEAVNFAMADWFSLGAEACLRYEGLNRLPLLPHEMLLCKEAAIIAQFDETRHDNYSCDLQAHVKVAFVAWMQSFLQSMLSLKRRGAKITTSKETRVLCGLCKHICHIAYTTCPCFPDATCFNHGDFFSTCTCVGERMIVVKDDFADLESLAHKFESEVEIRSRVQKLSSQSDYVKMDIVTRVAVNTQIQKSSLIQEQNSLECSKKQADKEKADNVGTIAPVESLNGAMSSDCRQGQEEEFSDTEVVQFKRRKVSLPQSKRFQVDEQEIVPEKLMVLTPNISDYLKVESSRTSDRNHFLSLKPLDLQARFGVAEATSKGTVITTHEPFDTSSDSEILGKRKRHLGGLAKVKRKRSTATLKDTVLSAEFHVDCAANQVAEIENQDSENTDLILHPTFSCNDGISIAKEESTQKANGIPAGDEIALMEKGMENTLHKEHKELRTINKVLQGSIDGELTKVDTLGSIAGGELMRVSALENANCMEHLSSEAVRFETDSFIKIAGSLTVESHLTEDLTLSNPRTAALGRIILIGETDLVEDLPTSNVRNIASELNRSALVGGSQVNDANGEDDACISTSKAAIADEHKTDIRDCASESKANGVNREDDACLITPKAAFADECKTDAKTNTNVNGSEVIDANGKDDVYVASEITRRAHVWGSQVNDANGEDDTCVSTSKAAIADEHKIDTRDCVSESKANGVNREDDACLITPKAAFADECKTDSKMSTNVNGSEVNDANGKDDVCVTTSEVAIADEGKLSHMEENCSSCEYRECETDLRSENYVLSPDVDESKVNDANGKYDACFVAIADQGKCFPTGRKSPSCNNRDYVLDLKNENLLLSSPAEAQPSVDQVDVQKLRNNMRSSEVKIMPLRDCDKSDTANFLPPEPKKGLVIHLNRKVEQMHKKKVADALFDEEKNSICENLMEHVNILEGQSGGSAWYLEQEVITCDSNQNDCKVSSPSGPSSLICGGNLMKKDINYGGAEAFSKDEPEVFLEIGQLIVGQQEAGKLVDKQDNFSPEQSKAYTHFRSSGYVKGGQLCEGEITQHTVAMTSAVQDSSSVDIGEKQTVGVLEVIDELPCIKNAIPPADYCDWQRTEWQRPDVFSTQVIRLPSSAGVCVPRDDRLREGSLSDARLAFHSSRLVSSNLHQSKGRTPNSVDKCFYEGQNFRAGDVEPQWGKNSNVSQCHLQGRSDFSSRQGTSHAAIMSNNHHRLGPSHNYRPRSLHGNHHTFQNDNTRVMKSPHGLQKRSCSRWERRPRRHNPQGWRGGRFEDRSPYRAEYPRVKDVSDVGFSAASSSTASVHVEGYDPVKWEIYPGANPWQFSSATPPVPPRWVERRP